MLVVIPTKDRWKRLVVALDSILSQKLLPTHILIVDQGQHSAFSELEKILKDTGIQFSYLHSYPETGLVRAKRLAVESLQDDLICFLEDDVVLDKEFLEEIATTFKNKPEAFGVGGICRNSPGDNVAYVLLHGIFYLGMFRDSRPWITFRRGKLGSRPVISRILSGGISAWRGEVLKAIPFIPEEGFHMMEDMHFCRKVTQRFGSRLLINPKATLQHFPAQEGRALKGEFEEQRLQEAFAFYRYHKKGFFDLFSFLWLILGLMVFSLCKSLLCQSSQPIRGHGRGVLICFRHWKKGG